MSEPLQRWTVLPHGKLTAIDDRVLTVVGTLDMPVVDVPRRMTVVRLDDGRLVVFSAMALDEDEMQALERFGRPAFLVVPSDHHRLDAKIWKDRYPDMQVVTPPGARDKVEETVPVDTVAPDFGDPAVTFVTVPGTQEHEAALVVRGPNGTTLVLNDVIANVQGEHGFGGWLLRVMGFAGDEPQVPKPVSLSLVKDKGALRAQLLAWSAEPTLKRILVSHGAPIEDEPAAALRAVADRLA